MSSFALYAFVFLSISMSAPAFVLWYFFVFVPVSACVRVCICVQWPGFDGRHAAGTEGLPQPDSGQRDGAGEGKLNPRVVVTIARQPGTSVSAIPGVDPGRAEETGGGEVCVVALG